MNQKSKWRDIAMRRQACIPTVILQGQLSFEGGPTKGSSAAAWTGPLLLDSSLSITRVESKVESGRRKRTESVDPEIELVPSKKNTNSVGSDNSNVPISAHIITQEAQLSRALASKIPLGIIRQGPSQNLCGSEVLALKELKSDCFDSTAEPAEDAARTGAFERANMIKFPSLLLTSAPGAVRKTREWSRPESLLASGPLHSGFPSLLLTSVPGAGRKTRERSLPESLLATPL
ncbi:hypothetical protein B0H13DRAFT_1913467 [Mycena leptocephala]|nr:hypothetical protein B0H13DRAFT_1913467 [Mycena leptocephala]